MLLRLSNVMASLVLAFVCAGCGPAPVADDVKGEVIEFGAFDLGPGAPGSRRAQFVEHTPVIVARLGSHFGFRFKVTVVPDRVATIDLKTVVTHPPMKMPDGRIRTHYELVTTIPIENGSGASVTGYGFDHPYEMVPGVWTFEHLYLGKTVVKQSFTVLSGGNGGESEKNKQHTENQTSKHVRVDARLENGLAGILWIEIHENDLAGRVFVHGLRCRRGPTQRQAVAEARS